MTDGLANAFPGTTADAPAAQPRTTVMPGLPTTEGHRGRGMAAPGTPARPQTKVVFHVTGPYG